MDNNSMIEMKKRLLELPYLEKKFYNQTTLIRDEERKAKELLEKYNEEAIDVENLQKETLSSPLLKLFGKFEDKLTKETQGMIFAKLQYDKLEERIKLLKIERDELQSRINSLRKDKALFEAEMQSREEKIKSNIDSELYLKYTEYVSEQEKLSTGIIEIDEAIRAANKVINSVDKGINHLESAGNWATFDIFTRGGILSHIAKYDHIDSAQSAFNTLSSQIKDLDKELSDINLSDELGFSGIDSTTRTIDFWLDNIFTDLDVRERIIEDNEKLHSLKDNVYMVVYNLEKNKKDMHMKIDDYENKKEDLLILGQ